MSSWSPEWHPTYAHICFVPQEAETGEYDDMCSGFYYADERDGLNGPYGSAEDAKDALDEYLENYQ